VGKVNPARPREPRRRKLRLPRHALVEKVIILISYELMGLSGVGQSLIEERCSKALEAHSV